MASPYELNQIKAQLETMSEKQDQMFVLLRAMAQAVPPSTDQAADPAPAKTPESPPAAADTQPSTATQTGSTESPPKPARVAKSNTETVGQEQIGAAKPA